MAQVVTTIKVDLGAVRGGEREAGAEIESTWGAATRDRAAIDVDVAVGIERAILDIEMARVLNEMAPVPVLMTAAFETITSLTTLGLMSSPIVRAEAPVMVSVEPKASTVSVPSWTALTEFDRPTSMLPVCSVEALKTFILPVLFITAESAIRLTVPLRLLPVEPF